MSCNIVINQQASLPILHNVATEKLKDPERQGRGKKSHETCMKKLKERFFKKRESGDADDLKRIYRLFSARHE